MYLLINGEKHSVSRRIVSADTIKYLSVEPAPENISGVIQMYTDENFLLSEDNSDNYERKTYVGTLLALTNAPEPVPQPVPESPYVTWSELYGAIREGVNEL